MFQDRRTKQKILKGRGTNSVYLPPRPNLLHPHPVLAADKPCWTEPSESGTYGDCKVLRLLVNSMFGMSGDERRRSGCSGVSFRRSSVPEWRTKLQTQTPCPPHERAHPRQLRRFNCRGKRERKSGSITMTFWAGRAASEGGPPAPHGTALRHSAYSSPTRCPLPAA